MTHNIFPTHIYTLHLMITLNSHYSHGADCPGLAATVSAIQD